MLSLNLMSLQEARSRLLRYEQAAMGNAFGRFEKRYNKRTTLAVLYVADEDDFTYLWGDRFVDRFVALQAIMSFESEGAR